MTGSVSVSYEHAFLNSEFQVIIELVCVFLNYEYMLEVSIDMDYIPCIASHLKVLYM